MLKSQHNLNCVECAVKFIWPISCGLYMFLFSDCWLVSVSCCWLPEKRLVSRKT